jgi:hypothetical protein
MKKIDPRALREAFEHDRERVGSPLYRWLAANRELIEECLREHRRWEPVCVCAAAEGITDGSGRPASPEVVRRVWYRLRQTEARRARRASSRDGVEAAGSETRPPPAPDARPVGGISSSAGALVPVGGASSPRPEKNMPPVTSGELTIPEGARVHRLSPEEMLALSPMERAQEMFNDMGRRDRHKSSCS